MARSHTGLATLLLAMPLAGLAHAQTNEQKQPQQSAKPEDSLPMSGPVLRLDVRRVPVDVIVLDRTGKPVLGLKPEDFIVREDRNPQQILSFDFQDGSVPSYVPPQIPPLPANTFINVPSVPERGPLYVLYYDMVNTDPADQVTFRDELLHFVDRAQPGTRIALFVNAAGLHLLQGFTSDHTLLRSAILAKGPGPHIPKVFYDGRSYGREDMTAAVSNLQFMAEYLRGIPGRKNLIWLAGKFPLPYGPVYRPVSDGGPREVADRSSIKSAFAAMMRAQVAISPVDVKGVMLWEERSPSPAGDAGSDFSSFHGHSSAGGPSDIIGIKSIGGSSGAGGGGSKLGPGSPLESSESMATDHGQTTALAGYSVSFIDAAQEDYIARSTGGHAYHGNNQISAVMEQVVETGQTFYTLSYAPTNHIDDGSERRIEVSVKGAAEKGYSLTYRNLYYAVSDEAMLAMHKADSPQARFIAAKAADPLYANIEHGAPLLHDLLFSARLTTDGEPRMATPEQIAQLADSPAYFRTRKHSGPQQSPAPVKLQKYLIDYGVIDLQLRAIVASTNEPETLEFAAAAYDSDGRLLNSILNEGIVSGEAQTGAKLAPVAHAMQELEVPQGASWIRLAVRDKEDNRTGALEVRLPLANEATSTMAGLADH